MVGKLNKHFWFLPFFYALQITRLFFNSINFLLVDFDNLIPGIATFDLINIDTRINAFYQSVGVFATSFILLWYISSIWFNKNPNAILSKFLNQTSILGFLITLLEFTTNYHENSIWLVVYLQCSFILFSAFNRQKKPIGEFLFLTGVAFSINFLVKESLVILKLTDKPDFLVIQSIVFIILYFVYKIFENKAPINKIVYSLIPVFFIPILSVLSDELYLISNQREIGFLSPDKIYLLIIIPVLFSIAFRFLKSIEVKSIKQFVNNKMPYFVLTSLVAITYYNPTLSQSTEMFELANPANGIMRIFKFHELPLLHFLNSHMFSELFFKIIYVLFNGYNATTDFLIYEFFDNTIFYIIALWFFKKIFRSWRFTLVFILFIPFLALLIPQGAVLSLISIHLLNKFYESKDANVLLQLLLLSIFLIFWRLDVGIANFSAVFLVIVFIFYKNYKQIKFNVIHVKQFGAIVIGTLFLFFLIQLFTEINIITNIKEALGYFGASQAHGLSSIAFKQDRFFYNIYFIFPIIVVGLLLYTINSIINSKKNRSNLILLSILFLCLYYIFNFQRGLVRHSLIEGDTFANSFFYLIILLFTYSQIKDKAKAQLVVLFLPIILISSFKYRDALGYQNLFEKFSSSYKNSIHIEKAGFKILRCSIDEKYAKEKYGGFVSFMDNNFSDTATFIDFSNTPMLYFYSQRAVPSYFNQYMQNTVTEFLQKRNIKNLQRFDIPVVVFSHLPEEWWDNTDGVPNTIRYYNIAQYIYNNYKPYGDVNGYYIWIRNNIDTENMSLCKHQNTQALTYDLKYYSYALGKQKEQTCIYKQSIETTVIRDSIKIESIAVRTDNYLEFNFSNSSAMPSKVKLQYGDSVNGGAFLFFIRANANNENYIIPVSSQYNWVLNKHKTFTVDKGKPVNLNTAKFIIKTERR